MKKIFSFLAPVLIIAVPILVLFLTLNSNNPIKTGREPYHTNDGRLSFEEFYGVDGDLQKKIVYHQDGREMIKITFKDGKETSHEFFP